MLKYSDIGFFIMQKKKGFRFWARSIFNFPRWIGWNDLRRNAETIGGMYRSLFNNKPKVVFRETFQDAVLRMGLSESDIIKIKNTFFWRAMIFLSVFISGVLYHIYLLYHRNWGSAFVMISIDFMLFSLFFREHFWYTQVRLRRLGLTFNEWLLSCFG